MSSRRLHLALLVLCVAAGTVHAADRCRDVPPRTSADYSTAGPYAVGRATFTFVDTSRPTAASGGCAARPDRTLETELWFPATSEGGATLDTSGAPYPLVVHSHGLLDYPTGEAYLAAHLASRGYVVAAPRFPLTSIAAFGQGCVRLADIESQPGDVSFVIDSVLAQLGAAIDAGRIAVSGLSFGGTTTLLAAFHPTERDARVRAAVAIAPGACLFTRRFFGTADVPVLILAGTGDALVPYRQNGIRPYSAATAPKSLVSLRDASHTAFAGVFAGAPGTPHPDAIGCAAIDDVVPDVPDPGNDPFAGLGGKENGIVSTPNRCPLPCQTPLPPSAMAGSRQHELTRIAATAFLAGALDDDVAARCFLRRAFAREQADVAVRAR